MPSSPLAHRGWTFGEFTLDLDRGALIRGGANVHLSPRPFAVLRHLVERHGRLVTKDELLDEIWGHRAVTDGAVTHSLIEIRRALGAAGRGYIRTVPRRGYVFEADVTPPREPPPEPPPASQPGPPEASLPAPAPAPAAPGRRRAIGWVGGLALGVLVAVVAQGWGFWNRTEDAVSPREVQPATYAAWHPSLADIEPHSVAVLPFADLSPERDQEYFTDGISEEILNRLSAFGELKVIARTSSFAFKDSGYDIPRISGLLAVNYLLQGSVRRDGQQLRISAQLVDRSGVQVWSSSFDRELGAIFALQEEIAEAVASSIVPHIVPPATAPRLPDLEAYQEYLAGREILASRRRPSPGQAMMRLDRAIELDPEFAEAFAERAVARVLRAWNDPETREMDMEGAQFDIDRALQLKPELGRAHAALGLLMFTRDPPSPDTQEAVLRRSLALDPNQVDAWTWLAAVLDAQGRVEDGTVALSQALRLDPLAPAAVSNMALREIRAGDVAAGEERLLLGLASPLADEMHYGPLIFLNLARGRPAEALSLAQGMVLHVATETGRPPPLMALIGNNALLGRHDQALQYLHRSREEFPGNLWMRVAEMSNLGIDTGVLDRAEALSELEALLPGGRLDVAHALVDSAMRYGELLALEGRHQDAIGVLEELSRTAPGLDAWPRAFRARQALAWAYLQSGERDKAGEVLAALLEDYRAAIADGETRLFDVRSGYLSGGLGGKALATLLMGDQDGALALLEQAAREGWRGYYGAMRDPRWAILRDEPRFRAVMAWVKEDLDAQRAAFEATNSNEDFLARLDAVIAEHSMKNAEISPP
jgi:TolB-like protein/DNA-binding winged helix-turn-helix (wHTH) protein/Flp pilus assembly protein TadD